MTFENVGPPKGSVNRWTKFTALQGYCAVASGER